MTWRPRLKVLRGRTKKGNEVRRQWGGGQALVYNTVQQGALPHTAHGEKRAARQHMGPGPPPAMASRHKRGQTQCANSRVQWSLCGASKRKQNGARLGTHT
jgi:hypothetical protein